jgi:hypothetical protein
MSAYPEIIVQIPLISQAEAKFGRQNAFRTVYFGEWVPFSIKQLGSDDAPVFARWDYMGGWADEREVMGREIVRVFEDQFYRPYRGDGVRLKSPHFDTSCLEEWTDKWKSPLFAIAARGGDDERKSALVEFIKGELPELSPKDAKQIQAHTLDAEKERLQNLGSALIIVDGKVWERCNEPVLALDYKSAYTNASANVNVVFTTESTDTVELFRLDDREGLLDFLRLVRKGRQANIVDDAANIEIELPQVISAEPERQAFIRVSKKIADGAEETIIAYGREATNAWFDLKEAVETAVKDRDGFDVDELLDTLRRFGVAHAKNQPLGNDYYSDRVELYANRIENRPLRSNHNRIR